MDKVIIENFRCFRERQISRLAPITLLVGENNTGKTSWMAILRVLRSVIYDSNCIPDFRSEPYDLGSFREIMHRGSDEAEHKDYFIAGLGSDNWNCSAKFMQGKSSTEVFELQIANDSTSFTWERTQSDDITLEISNQRGNWRYSRNKADVKGTDIAAVRERTSEWWGPFSLPNYLQKLSQQSIHSTKFKMEDENSILNLGMLPIHEFYGKEAPNLWTPPEAIAPIRTSPRRTYDPTIASVRPDGSGLPAHLAALAQFDKKEWKGLREAIERYGKVAGVFDELRIRQLGEQPRSDPFQIQVRNHVDDRKGIWRNLIDVGYGVNQILPILFQFARHDKPPMLHLQQPEIHLHPRAQAGLGSILCEIAASGTQLVVETHSNYLIDRIRMDIRDGRADLKPSDVSILFFERLGDKASIHNVGIDAEGNILDAPSSYGEFFMNEMNRLLGI